MDTVLPFPRPLSDQPAADAANPPAPDSGDDLSEVGLYGLGYYTVPILELCRHAGIRVAFVVDDNPEAHPDYPPASTCLRSVLDALDAARVPVWTNPEFCRQLERKAPLPALVASSIVNRMDGSVSTDPYLRSARLVREISGGGRCLLHPVVLAHALALPAYRKRVTLFGFPGSGNILAKHLLAELWQRIDASPPPSVKMVAAFAEHYYVSTCVLVRGLLGRLRPVGMDLMPMQFPAMDLSLELPGGEYVRALNIPGNRHLASFFNHTHATPTRLAAEELTRLGTLCVAIVRHPCETILSWASKVMRPPTAVLDRADFFRETTLQLAQWHRQLIDRADRFLVLRYEDLAARRRRPMQALAERLGVCLRKQEIDSLYDRFLNRDLQPALTPGHFYRGGSDKWRRYFRPHHMRQLTDAGIHWICRHWGYDLTLSEESAPQSPRDDGRPGGQVAGALPLERLYDLKDRLDVSEPYPLYIQSNSRRVSEAVRAALHGPEFLDHLNAAGLGPASPPWVPPVPWESLLPIFHPKTAEAGADRTPTTPPFAESA